MGLANSLKMVWCPGGSRAGELGPHRGGAERACKGPETSRQAGAGRPRESLQSMKWEEPALITCLSTISPSICSADWARGSPCCCSWRQRRGRRRVGQACRADHCGVLPPSRVQTARGVQPLAPGGVSPESSRKAHEPPVPLVLARPCQPRPPSFCQNCTNAL